MYQPLPFAVAPSDDALLWRYIDLAKLLALIEDRTFFFPRLEDLQKEDPYEGHPPRPFVEQFRRQYPPGMGGQEVRNPDDVTSERLSQLAQSRQRQRVYASCWHANTDESAAMWSLYSHDGEGIALRTTFSRLREAFPDTNISGGLVQYVDFETYHPRPNTLDWALLKRKSFVHEQEFRLLVIDTGEVARSRGISIPIQIDTLVTEVILAPTMRPWLADVIGRVLKRSGLKYAKSALLDGPSYDNLQQR
jgi:hypothetical protein